MFICLFICHIRDDSGTRVLNDAFILKTRTGRAVVLSSGAAADRCVCWLNGCDPDTLAVRRVLDAEQDQSSAGEPLQLRPPRLAPFSCSDHQTHLSFFFIPEPHLLQKPVCFLFSPEGSDRRQVEKARWLPATGREAAEILILIIIKRMWIQRTETSRPEEEEEEEDGVMVWAAVWMRQRRNLPTWCRWV